ncbi:HlyD family secretion protein [Hydrococcus rivularis NIES-593]|uniref:HlyD family secretion protein n=2 Tax=Hydrococcus TaxID=1616833 RepID=A0A1U7HCH2_9CYAN|nr:HlyD family secretion protein [Hydrococcus rivularis NIES-593]
MTNTYEPNQLPLVREDEFLPSIGSWITTGGIFLVLIAGGAIALSSILEFNVTVKAPATIRPAGELRLVQSAIEGTVLQIEVSENQTVKKGQIVARLDDAQLQIKRSQLLGDLKQWELQLVQLGTQLGTLDTQIGAESKFAMRSIAAAQAALRESERNYKQLQITTYSELQEAIASMNLAADELARYKKLEDTGAISKMQVIEKEAALKVATSRVQRLKAAINPTDASVARAREQVAQEKARGEQTLASLHQQKEQLLQNRIEIQTQIHRTQKELQQVEKELDGTLIRAPIDGTVLQLQLRNPGQVVQPGGAIAQIAPHNALMIVKARVDERDIGKVQTGQTVQMRVSACPYTDYGTLDGIVKAIAPDTHPTESSEAGAAVAPPSSYEVTIQPRTSAVGDKKERSCSLQFGMEGRADIISRRETVMQFVLRKARLLTDL